MKNMPQENETIFVEECMGFDSWAWVCSACKEPWVLENGTPKDNEYYYCPKCGRKIISYRPYEDTEEGSR